MTKIKIKVGKKDVEEAQSSGDFEPAPPGAYVATLKECKPGFAKGSDGKPDKDRPYLECIYRITGVGRSGEDLDGKNYSQIWDYVSFSEAAKWKMAQFALAMGLKVKNGAINESIELDPDKPGTIIGTEVVLVLTADTNREGDYRPKVRSVNALDNDDSDLFDDEDDEEEDPEDEEFESEDEDEDLEDEDEDEDDEFLTEEGLDSLAMKELKLVAEDFDLDADDYVVKLKSGKVNRKKTKASVIEAILDAQGLDDPEEESDEEDPF